MQHGCMHGSFGMPQLLWTQQGVVAALELTII
jgi:hypothetical protein